MTPEGGDAAVPDGDTPLDCVPLEEVPMQVMVMHHTPTLTRERYEHVVRGLCGKDRLESPADLPTPGLLVHVAAETDDGFMIFDVFESQEAFDAFRTVATQSQHK
jgi:hypothetical protein